jgi:hypothetical protein
LNLLSDLTREHFLVTANQVHALTAGSFIARSGCQEERILLRTLLDAADQDQILVRLRARLLLVVLFRIGLILCIRLNVGY